MTPFAQAAEFIARADALVVTAGAGMGVDSGLPDFRGTQGFWRAYPALARARMDFHAIASPRPFHNDPALAWGFYGHRLALYRATVPHEGFALLRTIAAKLPRGAFVFTSNVDGQFQKAGFDEARVVECHGSIHHLQCLKPCSDAIWSADGFAPEVDEARCRLVGAPPRCPRCRGTARPNVLMFGDGDWLPQRSREQERRLYRWLREVREPVVIEVGAGSAIPTVRHFGEFHRAPLVRINPTEWQVREGEGVGIAMGALAGIRGVAEVLRAARFLDGRSGEPDG
jgi:NAD-dependent SIR2 family protein deacetylase